MAPLYIPESLSRAELVTMLRSVPVTVDGEPTTLLDVGEAVRTGHLQLQAVPRTTAVAAAPVTADVRADGVHVERRDGNVTVHVHV